MSSPLYSGKLQSGHSPQSSCWLASALCSLALHMALYLAHQLPICAANELVNDVELL